MKKEYKVVLLGDQKVGKTSIIQQYVNETFDFKRKPTWGVAHFEKTIEMPKGVSVTLKIWDTAGQEVLRSMAQMHYQDAAAAILVYDITNAESFAGLKIWMNELKEKAPTYMKPFIAANKSDLIEKEALDMLEVAKYAKEEDACLKLTSAKENTGIQELFQEVARILLAYNIPDANASVVGRGPSFLLNPESRGTVEKKKKCC